jgi:hypothetical protein
MARALVESARTSVNLMVVTIRFWLARATAVQAPGGTTGDKSIPAKASGRTCHCRVSTALTRQGSHSEGCTKPSRRHPAHEVGWAHSSGPRVSDGHQQRQQVRGRQGGLELFPGDVRQGTPHPVCGTIGTDRLGHGRGL